MVFFFFMNSMVIVDSIKFLKLHRRVTKVQFHETCELGKKKFILDIWPTGPMGQLPELRISSSNLRAVGLILGS